MTDYREKTVYLIRHGETVANTKNAVQDGTDMLTPLGLQQADRVAERAKGLDFEVILASDYTRAIDTAEAIARATGKSIETSEHFREVKHPSQFVGLPRTDERFSAYQIEQYARMGEPEWHYDDEENFFDLRARAKRAEQQLVAHSADKILVVSHANFLKCLVGLCIFGDEFEAPIFRRLRKSLTPSNTGISILKYKKGMWHLVTYNDYSHLAD